MVGVKLSRQINQPKRDNLTDAAGYCETVRMVIDEGAAGEQKFRRPVRWRRVTRKGFGELELAARNGLAGTSPQQRHRQHMSDAGMDDGAFRDSGR